MKRRIIILIFIIGTNTLFSQSEKLEYDNIPFINEIFHEYTQFNLENNKYHYQLSNDKTEKIILNKNLLTYTIPYGDNEGTVECNINIDKSFQFVKNGKIMHISLYLDKCVNPKMTDFKINVKIHFVNVENQEHFIVDRQIIQGEYRGLNHNLNEDIIKELVASKELIIQP